MKTEEIKQLRNRIDVLDEHIVALLAKRLTIGRRIGVIKKHVNVSIGNRQREDSVLHHVTMIAKKHAVSPAFVEKIFTNIIVETRMQQSPMVKKPNGLRITIIGLGHIGGSLGLLIRQKTDHRVIGFSKSKSTRIAGVKIGAVHEVTTNPQDAVRKANIVILATPVKQTLKLLSQITPHLKPTAIVIDTGSVKETVCTQAVKVLRNPEQFIGGHPMAGTENSGIVHARADMFTNATWVITPTNTTNTKMLQTLQNFLTHLGFRIVCMSAEQHDGAVALTSHMPSFVAASLIQSLISSTITDIPQMVSSGFRDSTRLTLQNPQLLLEFARFNTTNLLHALSSHQKSIMEIKSLIEKKHVEQLCMLLKRVQQKRQNI